MWQREDTPDVDMLMQSNYSGGVPQYVDGGAPCNVEGEAVVQFKGWTTETRIQVVRECFESELQLWAVDYSKRNTSEIQEKRV